MRHSTVQRAALAAALIASLVALWALPGCSNLEARRPPAPPPSNDAGTEDRDTVAAVLMASLFQSMQHLAAAGPAEQADIMVSARSAFERSPQGSAKLRYALLLATPGHPARDPATAQRLLRELAAQPESLQPVERAVASIELAQLSAELGLKAENERLLLSGEQHAEHDRTATTQRRLQAEIDDNARLRRQLEDAQAKLDAIANIERNLTEHKPVTEGGTP